MKTQTLSLPRQIIDNENNFLNATLKVISRNQQWLHYHYHIFLILIEIISNKTVNVIQASTINYLLPSTYDSQKTFLYLFHPNNLIFFNRSRKLYVLRFTNYLHYFRQVFRINETFKIKVLYVLKG